jgi:hypothetical protein
MTDFTKPGEYRVHTSRLRDAADLMAADPTLQWADLFTVDERVCLAYVTVEVQRSAGPIGLDAATVLAIMCETDGVFVADTIGDEVILDFIKDDDEGEDGNV